MQRSRGEASAGTGRRLVRLRWSDAAAPPPDKYHAHTLSLTHSQLYNRTELSPVYPEVKQLLYLPVPSHSFLASSSFIHTHTQRALKINGERRFPQRVRPSHCFLSLYMQTTHTGKPSPSAGNLREQTPQLIPSQSLLITWSVLVTWRRRVMIKKRKY